jgi:hypothetical protein
LKPLLDSTEWVDPTDEAPEWSEMPHSLINLLEEDDFDLDNYDMKDVDAGDLSSSGTCEGSVDYACLISVPPNITAMIKAWDDSSSEESSDDDSQLPPRTAEPAAESS